MEDMNSLVNPKIYPLFTSLTETITLDGDSPNKKASSLISEEVVISNPKSLTIELSNKVIKVPPSATS